MSRVSQSYMALPFSFVYNMACINDSSFAGSILFTAYVLAFRNSCNLCRNVPLNSGIIVLASFNGKKVSAAAVSDVAVGSSVCQTKFFVVCFSARGRFRLYFLPAVLTHLIRAFHAITQLWRCDPFLHVSVNVMFVRVLLL